MSVVWVSSEPTNQLEEDHNCEGEDPLGGTPDELLRHSDHTGIGECHRTSNYGGNISSVEHTAAPTLVRNVYSLDHIFISRGSIQRNYYLLFWF